MPGTEFCWQSNRFTTSSLTSVSMHVNWLAIASQFVMETYLLLSKDMLKQWQQIPKCFPLVKVLLISRLTLQLQGELAIAHGNSALQLKADSFDLNRAFEKQNVGAAACFSWKRTRRTDSLKYSTWDVLFYHWRQTEQGFPFTPEVKAIATNCITEYFECSSQHQLCLSHYENQISSKFHFSMAINWALSLIPMWLQIALKKTRFQMWLLRKLVTCFRVCLSMHKGLMSQ